MIAQQDDVHPGLSGIAQHLDPRPPGVRGVFGVGMKDRAVVVEAEAPRGDAHRLDAPSRRTMALRVGVSRRQVLQGHAHDGAVAAPGWLVARGGSEERHEQEGAHGVSHSRTVTYAPGVRPLRSRPLDLLDRCL